MYINDKQIEQNYEFSQNDITQIGRKLFKDNCNDNMQQICKLSIDITSLEDKETFLDIAVTIQSEPDSVSHISNIKS